MSNQFAVGDRVRWIVDYHSMNESRHGSRGTVIGIKFSGWVSILWDNNTLDIPAVSPPWGLQLLHPLELLAEL